MFSFDPQPSPEEGVMATTFIIEYVIHNFMIPGQVENVLMIVDLKGMGLFNLPFGLIKAVL